MDAIKEKSCIAVLDDICRENFENDQYAILGVKECAVCIEHKEYGWEVYEKEKNSKNDLFLFDNAVDACLDVLKRLSTNDAYRLLKDTFYNRIITQRIA